MRTKQHVITYDYVHKLLVFSNYVGKKIQHCCGGTKGAGLKREHPAAITSVSERDTHNYCPVSPVWTGIAQSVWRLATDWTVWGSNPGGR